MPGRFDLLKYFFLLTCGLAHFEFCLAQQDQRTDSLLRILKNQPGDTARVNTLNAVSRRYFQMGDDSLSCLYAREAIKLGEKLNFNKGCMLGHTNLGLNYEALGRYPEAMTELEKALDYAQKDRDKRSIAIAYNNIGLVHGDQGNHKEAILYYTKAADMSGQAGDKRSQANAYYNLGNTYYSPVSDFTEAIKAHTKSLQLSKEINDKPRVSFRYIDIGNCYESLGNYPEAIRNYLSALKLSEELGNKANMGSAYNNIGEVYKNQGNNAAALKNYLTGLRFFEEAKHKYGICVSYDNIGEIYQRQGKYAEALANHLAALKLGEEMNYTYGMAYTYRNIGTAHFLQLNYANALTNYQSSLKLFQQIEEKEGMAKININIGDTYFRMKNLPEARKYLNQALLAAKEFQGKKIIKETYESLARLDSATGNWEEAYRDQKLFARYRDSLLNEENSNKITENMMRYEFGKKEDSILYQQILSNEKLKQQTLLTQQQRQALLLQEKDLALVSNEKKMQYLQMQQDSAQHAIQRGETDKKQGQLELLNKEKAIQFLELNKQKQVKKYLLAGFALVLLLGFLLYRNYRNRQQLKLQVLRNKIASDLHDDIGSTLSSISIFSQMAQQQSKEVIPLLETIGENSRKMLDAMADIVWTINPENDQFEKIILRMRSFAYELLGAKKIDFEFNADDEVSKMKLSMNVRRNLYLIFKEATNNMVKYSGANKAIFNIKGEKNRLTMLIRDNGRGFDTRQTTLGNGLKNMKKRAEEIGAQFLIESGSGKGTTVELRVAV